MWLKAPLRWPPRQQYTSGRQLRGWSSMCCLDVVRDVPRHQCGAELLRLEGRHLFVQGADTGALLVVQHRQADRARQAVLGELARRARIDDGVEFGELCYRRHSLGQFFRHGIQVDGRAATRDAPLPT
jgi:hypothetical protein